MDKSKAQSTVCSTIIANYGALQRQVVGFLVWLAWCSLFFVLGVDCVSQKCWRHVLASEARARKSESSTISPVLFIKKHVLESSHVGFVLVSYVRFITGGQLPKTKNERKTNNQPEYWTGSEIVPTRSNEKGCARNWTCGSFLFCFFESRSQLLAMEETQEHCLLLVAIVNHEALQR